MAIIHDTTMSPGKLELTGPRSGDH